MNLRTLILHDLHRMIKDFRFIILLVCGMILFGLNGFIFAFKYQDTERLNSDLRLTATIPWDINRIAGTFEPMPTNGASSYPRPSTIATELYVPPNPLLFLATGRAGNSPDAYDIRPGGIITPFYEEGSNSLLDTVSTIDWSYITIMLFVIFTILLGHSAISSERENGTLMQVLSNPVQRTTLFISRYISVMAVLSVVLLWGCTVSILSYLVLIPEVTSRELIIRVLMCIGVTFLLLSLFTFLSLLFSAYIRRSSLSLLLLLLLWMILIVFPYVSGVVVSLIYKDRTATYFKEQQKTIVSEYEKRMVSVFQQPDSPDFIGYFQSTEEAKEAIIPFENEFNRSIQNNYEQYLQTIREQVVKVRFLNRVSPIGMYVNTCECIAGSGVFSEERFWVAVKSYSMMYDAYVIEKTGSIVIDTKVSLLNPNIAHSALIHDDRGLWNYKFGSLSKPTEYEGDKSDFPGFVYRTAAIGNIAHESLPDIIGLIFWNLVLALSGLYVFMRADVR